MSKKEEEMNDLNEKWIWENGEEDRLSADTCEELIEIMGIYKQTIKSLREARKDNEKTDVGTKGSVNIYTKKSRPYRRGDRKYVNRN